MANASVALKYGSSRYDICRHCEQSEAISIRSIGLAGRNYRRSKFFPSAALLLTGAMDPMGNAHSEDESLDLADFEKSCLAEALFLGYLAAPAG